ncbi:MAG: PocR ligand-binding domain-containing protein [Proteobacteria bacterium]|nr:PocR ligand-binding domain-containing protein [Pseudomonadota bacterium]
MTTTKPTYQESEQNIAELDLCSIINVEELRTIMEDFYNLTHMATAVLDLKGNVIEATGWQDICTKFHRIYPKTACNCTESDLFLAKNLKPGEYINYKCKNGLWDVVTPLYVGENHLGNIYTGQFFYDDEEIDEEFFIKQAETCGFDKDLYLDALRRVPRINRKTVNYLMQFLVKFTKYISRIGSVNIQLEKEICERKRTEKAHWDSESFIKSVMDNLPIGIAVHSVELPAVKFEYMNDNFFKLHRTTREALADPDAFWIAAYEDHEFREEIKKRVMDDYASGDPAQLHWEDVPITRKGEETSFISAQNVPVPNKSLMISTVWDVTDRKHVELSLKESESRFRELFENLYDGVAVYAVENDGKDFRFVDINLSGQVLSKVKKENAIGKSITSLFPGIRELGLFEVLQRVYRTGKTERLPMAHYMDGRISQWVDNTVFKLPSGEIVAVYRDESDRYIAEEALKERERLLTEVGKIAKIGGWEMDLTTSMSKWTQGTYDIVEIDYDQPIPGPDEHIEYYLPEYRSLVSDAMQALIEDDRPLDFEAQLQTAKGNIKWCRAIGRAIREKGCCIKVYGTFQDITDRKKTEEEIHKLNRDLELRVRQRTAQLEDVNKELEDFVYSISHDLRAPLRSIGGFAEIIDRRHKASLNEEGQHYFGNIVKASRQMDGLIDDLLQFSRLGRKAIKSESVLLDKAFKAAIETLADQINKTDTRILLPEKMPAVQGDFKLITHVFINLLENAIKYHKPDETPIIDVGLEVSDQYIVLSIADNGIGIAPEYHEKIFNIFQRLHSQADYPGTGIGLAAVKKALQIMDGRVWVESEPDKGSVFKIKLLKPIST